MAPFDPLADQTCAFPTLSRSNRSDDYGPDPCDEKAEDGRPWTNPHQKRPSRVKNKTPLRVRAAKRHRKNKAAKIHRKAIKIALATKRNRSAKETR